MRRQFLPVEQINTWSRLNGVQINSVAVTGSIRDGSIDKGAGLVAATSLLDTALAQSILLSVPSDLILSKTRVEESAKVDKDLRDVLTATGELSEKSRITIMIFLLLQITHASPDIDGERIGVTNPFTDYVKFLPKEIPLPTFYSGEEQEILRGTSLMEALEQKLASLEKEFDHLKETTQAIPWCQKYWWDEGTGHLTFEDWKLTDAMYRSRALELPGIGDAMAPLIDMVNHSANDSCTARFEVNPDGSVLLLLRDGKALAKDEEITITYGTGGACESIFSYGFLEIGAITAREMFLNLDIPADDPLRLAKKTVAQVAPGVRLYVDQSGSVCWDSRYVWWVCVNEEDGLEFHVLQKTDGSIELATKWKNEELEPSDLEDTLSSDEMADIFKLRAIVTIQERLEQQGASLQECQGSYDAAVEHPRVRQSVWETVGRLRELELELLSSAFESLEDQKVGLMGSPSVQRYLGTGGPEDDFS